MAFFFLRSTLRSRDLVYNVLGHTYSFNLRNFLSISFENYLDHLHLVLSLSQREEFVITHSKRCCYLLFCVKYLPWTHVFDIFGRLWHSGMIAEVDCLRWVLRLIFAFHFWLEIFILWYSKIWVASSTCYFYNVSSNNTEKFKFILMKC